MQPSRPGCLARQRLSRPSACTGVPAMVHGMRPHAEADDRRANASTSRSRPRGRVRRNGCSGELRLAHEAP
jgi:hypothetical protein